MWADKLNRYHLFDEMDNALAFVQFSDERVKEHAPLPEGCLNVVIHEAGVSGNGVEYAFEVCSVIRQLSKIE